MIPSDFQLSTQLTQSHGGKYMNQEKKKARLLKLREKLTLLGRLSALDKIDVDGSYTGTGEKDKRPVQDADDL
jgi:hypothetical protein